MKYFLLGIIVLIIYLVIGVPFIVASPIKSRLCIGTEGNAENLLTHKIKFYGNNCNIPIGWKYISPTVFPK